MGTKLLSKTTAKQDFPIAVAFAFPENAVIGAA